MNLDIDSQQQESFEASLQHEEDKFLYCAICDHRICHRDNKISINGSHTHDCRNPAGIDYAIACFSEAAGCRQIGETTSEHSWFKAYSWQITLCENCGEHMGWFFQSEDHFYGLIRSKLIQH